MSDDARKVAFGLIVLLLFGGAQRYSDYAASYHPAVSVFGGAPTELQEQQQLLNGGEESHGSRALVDELVQRKTRLASLRAENEKLRWQQEQMLKAVNKAAVAPKMTPAAETPLHLPVLPDLPVRTPDLVPLAFTEAQARAVAVGGTAGAPATAAAQVREEAAAAAASQVPSGSLAGGLGSAAADALARARGSGSAAAAAPAAEAAASPSTAASSVSQQVSSVLSSVFGGGTAAPAAPAAAAGGGQSQLVGSVVTFRSARTKQTLALDDKGWVGTDLDGSSPLAARSLEVLDAGGGWVGL